jgi:C4-dicarboxylate-binding protein DctP
LATSMKKLGILSATAILAATLGSSVMAQDVTLKLQHFLSPMASVPKQVLEPWVAEVAKKSDNRIVIDIYPAMQLGGTPPSLMGQTQDGIIDIGWTVIGYTPGRFPRSEVFELPFMMKGAPAATRAFWQMFETHMKETEFKDVKVLATWVHGPGLIHSKDPIVSTSDLRGVKIRGGSRMVNNLLSNLGATPVGMPVPAVPESLSKGVINATTIPWEVTAPLKVSELVSNHTEFGDEALYTLTFALVMNKAKYEALPDDLKRVIDETTGEEFSVRAATLQQGADAPARAIAEAAGNNIIQLDDAQIAEWKAASAPVYADWIADMEGKDIDGAALIEEARTLISKYSK